MLLDILDGSPFQKCCHGSTVKDRNFQQKLINPKSGLVFDFNMLLAILDGSPFQKCCHGSTVKDRNFQQKPITLKFELIFNLNIFNVSHYQNIVTFGKHHGTGISPMSHRSEILHSLILNHLADHEQLYL